MLSVSILLALALAAYCQSHQFDMSSCKMSMTCDAAPTAQGKPTMAHELAVGRPGKRGNQGIKGERGEKGDKGDTGHVENEFKKLKDRISELRNDIDVHEGKFADLSRQPSQLPLHKKCPQTAFLFPKTKQVTDYIRIKKAIPRMDELTICTWFTPSSNPSGWGFAGYATQQNENALVLYLVNKNRLDIYIHGDSKAVAFNPMTGTTTRMCVAISSNLGLARTYVNGTFIQNTTFSKKGWMEGGGSFIIGQEQDSVLGNFDSNQAYAGTIENFMVWYRVLTGTEIRELHNDPCKCPTDYSFSLSPDEIQLEGKVIAQPTTEC